MLRASLTLSPATDAGHRAAQLRSTPAHAPPPSPSVELLRDVYVCASSPAVTEEWEGWPHAPSAVTSLASLLRVYNAGPMQVGGTAVQVLAIGAHCGLSCEAKAMVAGAVVAALRAHLSTLLRGHCVKDGDEGPRSGRTAAAPLTLRETLRKCCRFSASSSSPSTRPATSTNDDGDACEGANEGGTWRVTWSSELLTRVASSLAQHSMEDATTLTVCQCRSVLSTSVEVGVRARLQRDDQRASSGCSDLAGAFPDTLRCPTQQDKSSGSSSGRKGTDLCDTMLVQLRSCAPVRTHPLSVRHAIHLGCLLYRSHVCSAQEHAEDGTEAFKEVLMLAEAMRHRRSNNCSKKGNEEDIGLTRLWQRALTSYHDSAAAAQDGVLFLLTHNIAVHGGAPLIPLRAAEEDAFVQVAVAAQQAQSHAELGGTVAVGEAVLASMRLRGSSGAYFNHVLLTQQWDTSLCEGQSAVMQTVKAVEGGDATLAPARAALRWRTFLGSRQDRQPHAGVGADAAFNVATTLQPTPLQWILYTLRRQLIVAVANTAQVMLTGQRLHLDGTSSSSFSLSSNPPTPPLSVSCLRAHATSCVKAQALLRGLIRWHCPYPVPLPLLHHHNSRNGKVIASATDVVQQDAAEELLWCLRLMAKLHFRAAALYGAAGDVSRQQEQLRRWQDQLQRWNSRRAAHLPEGREETSRGDTAVSWSTSVEDVAGHVEAAAWAVFAKEASTGLPVAR